MKRFSLFLEKQIDQHLTEGFSPTETEYGINHPDYDNGEFNRRNITFFRVNNKIVRIRLETEEDDDYTLKFATSQYFDNPNEMEFISGTPDTTIQNDNALAIFNKVIYVVKEFMNTNNVRSIGFEGASPRLAQLYNIMLKNKRFNDMMGKYGMVYDKELSDYSELIVYRNNKYKED